MNKKNVIEALASKTGWTKADATKAVNAMFEIVEESVKSGEGISITGLGSISVVKRPARTGVNPRTGEKAKYPAKNIVKVKIGATLKAAAEKAKIKKK